MRYVLIVLKAGISIGLVAWLLSAIELANVWDTLRSASPSAVALAIISLAFGSVLVTVRWRAIAAAVGLVVGFRTALALTFVGNFFSQVLPSTVGGDGVRLLLLYRRRHSLANAAFSLLFDRAVGLGALVVLMGLTLPAFLRLVPAGNARTSMVAVIGLGLAGMLGCALLAWLLLRFPALRALPLLRQLVAMAAPGGAHLDAPVRTVTVVVGTALIVHLATVVAVSALANGLGVPLPFVHCLVLVPPVVLISGLPLSIAGWGLREGAMVVALGFAGVEAAQALVISLLLGLCLIAVSLPGGVLVWSNKGARKAGELHPAAPPVA